MADFTRYQDVVLLCNIPEEGLCASDVGTIAERHDVLYASAKRSQPTRARSWTSDPSATHVLIKGLWRLA